MGESVSSYRRIPNNIVGTIKTIQNHHQTNSTVVIFAGKIHLQKLKSVEKLDKHHLNQMINVNLTRITQATPHTSWMTH